MQRIVIGSSLLLASWGLDFLPYAEPQFHAGIWTAVRTLAPVIFMIAIFLLGAVTIWRSYVRLKDGIRNQTWSDEQLDAARQWSNAAALSWSTYLILVGSVVTIVLGHIFHFRWNVLVPIYSTYPLLWMRTALRKPAPPRVPEDWKQRPRFFSSHWGEAPADRSSNSSA